MEDYCCKDRCLERVTYACNCSVPAVYCCNEHLAEHARTPGSHMSEYIIITLTQDQRTEQLPRLLERLGDLQRLEHEIVKHAEAIVNCIQAEASKALKHIRGLKKTIIDLITDEGVNKRAYEAIDYFTKESLRLGKIEEIKKKSSNLFQFNLDMWKECNEVIFSRDQ